jgi:hypothetical protein
MNKTRRRPVAYNKFRQIGVTDGRVHETGDPCVVMHSDDAHIYFMLTQPEDIERLAKSLGQHAAWLRREQGRKGPLYILPSTQRVGEKVINGSLLGL